MQINSFPRIQENFLLFKRDLKPCISIDEVFQINVQLEAKLNVFLNA